MPNVNDDCRLLHEALFAAFAPPRGRWRRSFYNMELPSFSSPLFYHIVLLIMSCAVTTIVTLVLSDMAHQAAAAAFDGSNSGAVDMEGMRPLEAEVDFGSCNIPSPRLPDHDLTPFFAASYPGSGASMVRHLIESLTGLATGDEWFRITRRAVALKTHAPHGHGTTFEWSREIDYALLLIRNPRDALPSFCNHLYEKKQNLTHHTTRAPVDEWIEWRNENFAKELRLWEEFVQYWVQKFPPDRRLVVTYEGLTNDSMGPDAARSVASFIERSVRGVRTAFPEGEIPCVWHKVVKYDETENKKGGMNFGSLRSGEEGRPYTRDQLVDMVTVLGNLRDRYAGTEAESLLAVALGRYVEDIRKNLRLQDEEMNKNEKAVAAFEGRKMFQ